MIQLKNVTKIYEDTGTVALSDLSMDIQAGEFILVTGKSGCGKTTLIRLLLKEAECTSGEIYVNHVCLNSLPPKRTPYYRREVGVVFQDFRLLPTLTAYENVEMARVATGGSRRDAGKRIASLFSMLGITELHKRYPEELSGGQMQKVALARALVNQPSILLADEPTGNLDYEASVEIMKLFELIHKQGTTVLVATHGKEAAQGLSYREIQL